MEKINTENRYFWYNGRVVTLTEYRALASKGAIPSGQMGKRELTASQKKKLAANYKKARENGKRPTPKKAYSSEKTPVRRGVRVVSLKNPLSSKSQASVRNTHKLPTTLESKGTYRFQSVGAAKSLLIKHAASSSKDAIGSSGKVSIFVPSRTSASKTSKAVTSRTSPTKSSPGRATPRKTTPRVGHPKAEPRQEGHLQADQLLNHQVVATLKVKPTLPQVQGKEVGVAQAQVRNQQSPQQPTNPQYSGRENNRKRRRIGLKGTLHYT